MPKASYHPILTQTIMFFQIKLSETKKKESLMEVKLKSESLSSTEKYDFCCF